MADPATTGPSRSDERTPDDRLTRRVVLGLSYDGAGFRGFAAQPGQRTVGGALIDVLEQLTGAPVRITCAGRTDAGVHAAAQVVHVDLDAALLDHRWQTRTLVEGDSIPRLAESLTSQLGGEVVVWKALLAPEGFDARRSAIARRYRYSIDNGARPDPLRRGVAWFVDTPLDIAAMRLAADTVLGEHDFAAFCRRAPGQPDGPIVRRVTDACWHADADGRMVFEIEANAFCHQMVRSIVGAFVAAGRRTLRPSDVVALLESKSRVGAPNPAPAGGLCLVAVRYPQALTGDWA